MRDEGVSGRLTRLDLQDLVAARPVEALQDSSHMRLVNGENSRLCKLDAPSPLTPEVAVITLAQTHLQMRRRCACAYARNTRGITLSHALGNGENS